MSNGHGSGGECSFGMGCSWVVMSDGSAACEVGTSTCDVAKLLEAELSTFHDATLAEATRKISEVLEGIPPDPQGRKLAFLHTNFGSLLAWVEHKGELPADQGIRPDADDATIAKALRLKGYAASGAGAY
jgi:hypothetical protein